MTALREELAAPFDSKEVRQFTKEWTNRAGEKKSAGPFDFIEDETVMDRLDDVVGLGNWYVHTTPIGDTAVRVVLGVRFSEDAPFVEYEDFGYATRADSPEPYKEAVSDGIRRCGRYVGIARYLYRKHDARDIAESKKLADSQSAARGDGLVGIARIGDRLTSDGEIRESLEGPNGEKLEEPMSRLGFRLEPREGDKGAILVEAWGELAIALALGREGWADKPVTCWGSIKQRSFAKGKTDIKYQALLLTRMQAPDFTIPAPEGGPGDPPEAGATSGVDDSASGEAASDIPVSEPEAAGASSPEPTEAPAAPTQCDAASPYGDDGRCELLEGHKGAHAILSTPFPEKWTD